MIAANLRSLAKMNLGFATSWIEDLQMQVAGDFDESRALNPDVDPLTEALFSLNEAIRTLEVARHHASVWHERALRYNAATHADGSFNILNQ